MATHCITCVFPGAVRPKAARSARIARGQPCRMSSGNCGADPSDTQSCHGPISMLSPTPVRSRSRESSHRCSVPRANPREASPPHGRGTRGPGFLSYCRLMAKPVRSSATMAAVSVDASPVAPAGRGGSSTCEATPSNAASWVRRHGRGGLSIWQAEPAPDFPAAHGLPGPDDRGRSAAGPRASRRVPGRTSMRR